MILFIENNSIIFPSLIIFFAENNTNCNPFNSFVFLLKLLLYFGCISKVKKNKSLLNFVNCLFLISDLFIFFNLSKNCALIFWIP